MASVKVVGIETEYGIAHRGVPEPNPILASSLLINAYLRDCQSRGIGSSSQRIIWDFLDETPGNDARGFAPAGAQAPTVDTHMVNAVLTNGARYYVDHAHPEMSTPECLDARDVLLYDRAGELIIVESMRAARALIGEGEELIAYKNNSDGKGNSYGTHENYLMSRSTPFEQIVSAATLHFVTRQIYTGSGKVGCEAYGSQDQQIQYQLTQRADFFEEEVGLETTLKRPIINTRDEPHADPRKYRRLHVIVGDANLSQFATWLKVGTTLIVLAMVEDEQFLPNIAFENPVQALRQVSYDLSLSRPLTLKDGSKVTALEIQTQILEAAEKYIDRHGPDGAGGADAYEVLKAWRETLETLETDPNKLSDRVDWIAKKKLIDAYRKRDGIEWGHPRLKALDLQYSDMRPGRCLAHKLGLIELVDDEDARLAMTEPPPNTRAYFRGECLKRYADSVVSANWDSIVLDTGTTPLARLPMQEPVRGSKEMTESLFDSSTDPGTLVEKLQD